MSLITKFSNFNPALQLIISIGLAFALINLLNLIENIFNYFVSKNTEKKRSKFPRGTKKVLFDDHQ